MPCAGKTLSGSPSTLRTLRYAFLKFITVLSGSLQASSLLNILYSISISIFCCTSSDFSLELVTIVVCNRSLSLSCSLHFLLYESIGIGKTLVHHGSMKKLTACFTYWQFQQLSTENDDQLLLVEFTYCGCTL